MRSSCAVCVLAAALCLVVCVSATVKVTRVDAEREVAAAKEAVTAVCARAQSELDNAKGLLDKVEASKREATDAKVKSQKAPQDNTDAVAIAKAIESLSDDVDKLYATEKQKLEGAVNNLNTLLSNAQALNDKPEIKIEPDTDSTDDFTGANGEATTLKADAAQLNGQIDTAVQLIAGKDTTANEMEQKAKEAQLKDAHVSVIVFVSKIETMLRNADTTILQIDGKKNAVSGIVGEMQTLKIKHPTVSDANIEGLHQSADNALRDATGAVQNANSAKADIQKQKDIADAVLKKVQPETQEVNQAEKEVQNAEACVTAALKIVPQLEAALLTATNSVTSATDLKKKLQTSLSTTTTALSTVQATETEKTDHPVVDGTEPDQKDTTVQQTSKDSPAQTDNIADKLKETLTNGAQNVPTTALTGGKAPAPGAKNDSAMTVSVPLLVALIASAVLQ